MSPEFVKGFSLLCHSAGLVATPRTQGAAVSRETSPMLRLLRETVIGSAAIGTPMPAAAGQNCYVLD